MKRPTVFSLVRDQSVFMTAIMSLLTFLAVLAFGVALSIGTGVARWNAQWDLFATVQVTNSEKSAVVKKILADNNAGIVTATQITTEQMSAMLRPWISGGGESLQSYLPQMWEVKFKSKSDMKRIGDAITQHARFLTHSAALGAPIAAGWRMMAIAGLVLVLILGAIAISVSYIARNTAVLHRRELEILNQVGAADSFIARQMQIIVTKICVVAAFFGFIVAAPILMLIIHAAHRARVGLMAMIGISGAGWIMVAAMPVVIVVLAIYITRRTTLKILENS